jgi:hypothetical protein
MKTPERQAEHKTACACGEGHFPFVAVIADKDDAQNEQGKNSANKDHGSQPTPPFPEKPRNFTYNIAQNVAFQGKKRKTAKNATGRQKNLKIP